MNKHLQSYQGLCMLLMLLFSQSAFAQLSVSLSNTSPTCSGFTNGAISATASNGQAPYFYVWNTGFGGSPIQNLGAGSFSVTVTDANGATATAATTLAAPAAVDVQIVNNGAVCSGSGNLVATATGGNGNFTYAWSTGATTASTMTSGGFHCVTVTDSNGCADVACINVLGAMSTTVKTLDSPCFMFCDGTAEAVTTGGQAPYTYNWNTGQTSILISPLPPGVYTVTVTDVNGCTNIASGTINEPAAIVIGFNTNSSACGGASGSATATATGGTAPFRYFWSTGAQGQTINNLGAGSYSVTVVDANNCAVEAQTSINAGSNIQLTATGSTTGCLQSTGSATASATGGTAPYTYAWSNGGSAAAISSLAAGNYTVTVTDAAGCIAIASAMVSPANGLIVSNANTAPTSCGTNNGSITVNTTGGSGNYSYNWSTGATASTINNLSGGNYSVTVTDVTSGCTATANSSLQEPLGFSILLPALQVSCFGGNNGEVGVMIVSGGQAPFSYAWSNGATTSNQFNVSAGSYSVTVTDAAGCVQMGSVTVAQPAAALTCQVNGTQPTTTTSNNGSASVAVTGGSAPFTYEWSNGGTSSTISGLAAGTYSVTVTDLRFCTTVCSVVLVNPIPPANAKLGDLVFEDSNMNGIQDIGEFGVGGVTVTLNGTTATGQAVTATTTTSGNGMYMFGNLMAGSYKITVQLPTGYTFSPSNAGSDDTKDSDVIGATGMSGFYTLVAGDMNLTIDAGIFCANATGAGTIAANQVLCGPGNTPATLTQVTPAQGNGPFEYLWMRTNVQGPFNNTTWTPILNSNAINYSPGPIYETTYFARCVRRVGCSTFLESNIITVTVGTEAIAEISAPIDGCTNTPITFTAADAGAGAVYAWDFGLAATPRFSTSRIATPTFSSFGYFNVKLTVNANGCTGTRFHSFSVGCVNSPIINAMAMNRTSIMVSLEGLEGFQMDDAIRFERSKNGVQYEIIGNTTVGQVMDNNYNADWMDYTPFVGRNHYRAVVLHDGQSYTTSVATAALFNDTHQVLVYPNPARDAVQVEFSETTSTMARWELMNAAGAVLLTQNAGATSQRSINLAGYSSGVYYLRCIFSDQTVRYQQIIKE